MIRVICILNICCNISNRSRIYMVQKACIICCWVLNILCKTKFLKSIQYQFLSFYFRKIFIKVSNSNNLVSPMAYILYNFFYLLANQTLYSNLVEHRNKASQLCLDNTLQHQQLPVEILYVNNH